MKNLILTLLIVHLFSSKSVFSQVGNVNQNSEKKPTIMFVGTYHMGKQGSNVFKGEYDDILSPKRQKELKILLNKLKEFKPTKVVIERDVKDSSKILSRYHEYLEGKYKLTRNETNQIGFRLAKDLNHKEVFCVDWGIFPDDPLYNYETFAKSDPELNDFLIKIRGVSGAHYKEQNQQLNKLSILDRIRLLNAPENIEIDHKGYFEIMRIGKGDKYAGANYLSWWYGRNMKILVNIIRITKSDDDRILVIYGSGHSKLLTQLTKESQFYNIINPLKILNQ